MKTKVKFLIEKDEIIDGKNIGGDVFAYFPNENYYSKGNIGYGGVTADNWQNMKTCYSHIGQHSACHPDYAESCFEATPEQYADLKKELEGQGYELKVINKTAKQIKAEVYAMYVKKGQASAFDVANKYELTDYEFCNGCETDSPIITGEHECLICGQPTDFTPTTEQTMQYFRNREQRGL